jgi:nitrogen fixation NifU-like protein
MVDEPSDFATQHEETSIMTDNLDSFVSRLQEDIFQQTLEDYGPEFFESWKNPRNMGKMENPTTSASLTGSCGDLIEIALKIDGQHIAEARFLTTGCGPSIACANTACELAKGKDLEEAAGLEDQDILEVLKTVPKDKEHCAHLAAQTLREAIRTYWATH